jgi:hypothetical protein
MLIPSIGEYSMPETQHTAGNSRPLTSTPNLRPVWSRKGQIPSIPTSRPGSGRYGRERPYFVAGRDLAILSGIRPDPVHPGCFGRSRPDSRNGRISSSLPGSCHSVREQPGSSCFGRITRSRASTRSSDGKRTWPIFLMIDDEGYFCICISCHIS